eukprot:5303853-Lingulodinium_polyedra.AAC.1
MVPSCSPKSAGARSSRFSSGVSAVAWAPPGPGVIAPWWAPPTNPLQSSLWSWAQPAAASSRVARG